MTLHPIPSEFPYIWDKFCFLFYQCGIRMTGYMCIRWMEYPEGLSSVRLFFAVSGPTGLYLVVWWGGGGLSWSKECFVSRWRNFRESCSMVREMFMIPKKPSQKSWENSWIMLMFKRRALSYYHRLPRIKTFAKHCRKYLQIANFSIGKVFI